MKHLLIPFLLFSTPALAEAPKGPWQLFACVPNMGPAGCVLIGRPATQLLCIDRMNELYRSEPKGTIVACVNGPNGVPILPKRD